MNLCKWNRSSENVTKEIKYKYQCDSKITKLLGMKWKRVTDEIGLAKLKNESVNDIVTKRNVLMLFHQYMILVVYFRLLY